MSFTNPTTRISLILRLNNLQDASAWEEFVAVYQPMIWRIAKRLGMSDIDAADACQNTMIRLTQVVHQWSPSRTDSTFRGWLYRVARNCMLRQFERENKHARLAGGSGQTDLEQVALEISDVESSYDVEFRRQVFAAAADRVRPDFNTVYWQAFWLTYVKNKEIREVARLLDTNIRTVYVARCRVLKRIRQEVEQADKSGLVEFSGLKSTLEASVNAENPTQPHDNGGSFNGGNCG